VVSTCAAERPIGPTSRTPARPRPAARPGPQRTRAVRVRFWSIRCGQSQQSADCLLQ
jgi:hypothetical protein